MKFTEEHEWLLREGDHVIVGITEHAANELGDLVFVELPEVDTAVVKDDHVVTIESVKAASDILAPLDGKIIEVNDAVVSNPAMVSEDAQAHARRPENQKARGIGGRPDWQRRRRAAACRKGID